MFKDFKEFIARGNIMDLAVGVVIGGAFQKIIDSLVSDIIMPAISMLTKNVDFTDMSVTVGEATLKYGNFITAIVNFLIIAFSIFLTITYLNKLNKKMEEIKLGQVEKISKKIGKGKKEEPKVEPTVKKCPYCYSEINFKATRCPNCTSELETKLEKKVKEIAEDKKEKVEQNNKQKSNKNNKNNKKINRF